MSIFNNREIAIAFWLIALAIWSATNSSVRTALVALFRAFFNRSILTILSVMALYVAFAVYCLHLVGLWDFRLLKSTILWSIFVAAALLFRIFKVQDARQFIKAAALDNLKIVVVLEFIVNFYTFPLLIELFLVLLSMIFAWMYETSKGRADLKIVHDGVEIILTAIGVTLVVYAVIKLVANFGSFATIETLVDFSLPPLLSLLYLPFLFMVALYVAYERAFAGIGIAIKDPSLSAFAKRRALMSFHFRTQLLQRWKRNVVGSRPNDRKEVLDTIVEVKKLAARERDPIAVPFEDGWSPYLASAFLCEEGLQPNDYHRAIAGCDQWFASSPSLEIGDGVLPNNIAYYVEGNESSATLLKIVLNINEIEDAGSALDRFVEIATTLFRRALNASITPEIVTSLSLGKCLSIVCRDKQVIVEKEEWPNKRRKGYTTKFMIRNRDAGES